MKRVFIDTGAFLAKEIAADQHHSSASKLWQEAHAKGWQLCSSGHVLDEAATLLARRTNYAWASAWGHEALTAGIEWIATEATDWPKAFDLMRKYADQGVSCTDCLSFVLLKRTGIKWVFTYDHHFASAGFSLLAR